LAPPGRWTLGETSELSVAFTHAFEETVEGSGSIPAAFGGGEADIRLAENLLGIAYGRKF
jgi:long-chain fatty acid transport protein